MARKTLTEFIKENRKTLDQIIDRVIGEGVGYRNDEERRNWVLNDEGLYNWAKIEGVRI